MQRRYTAMYAQNTDPDFPLTPQEAEELSLLLREQFVNEVEASRPVRPQPKAEYRRNKRA